MLSCYYEAHTMVRGYKFLLKYNRLLRVGLCKNYTGVLYYIYVTRPSFLSVYLPASYSLGYLCRPLCKYYRYILRLLDLAYCIYYHNCCNSATSGSTLHMYYTFVYRKHKNNCGEMEGENNYYYWFVYAITDDIFDEAFW